MCSLLVDMSKDDCRKALRTLELETYGSMVSVLRAQGHFSADKKKLLSEVATALYIPVERHKAEIRKAVNDDVLNYIADKLVGPNTCTEWAIEGRRLFPPFPKTPQCTAFAVIADEAADYISGDHESFASASEAAKKAADFPFVVEPASPEPSKTQVQSSDSGVLVLPSGAAIQMKRESEDEETDRKKKRAIIADSSQQLMSPSSPPTKIMVGSQGQHIPMSSRTMQFPTGSGQLKIAMSTSGSRTPNTPVQSLPSNAKQQLIIVSSTGTQNTPSILQKTLSVPMKSSAMKPNVMYSPNTSTNATETIKQRQKQPVTSTPVAKARPNAIVVAQKQPIKATATPTKMPMHTKIVLQQKPVSRGAQKPQQVMLQQKPGKQGVLTNVQVKTPGGFTSVPVQLRATKQQAMQLKQDGGGQMKVLSLSGGTKILPKPSQPVYVVTASTTPLTMVTRTVPASCPPRVMTVNTGSQAVKWNQSPVSGKTMQTVHVVGTQRRHENVVLFQKSPAGKMTPVSKDGVTKVQTKTSQKPMTTAIAQSLHQLPVQQTQSGTNVILLDLSNSDKVTSPVFADILQASGILTEDGKTVAIDIGSSGEEVEDSEKKITEVAPTTMSIEQAVEMLNRSDTPETRRILSQAGIQISDEIADSEEEEQVMDGSQIPEQVSSKHESTESDMLDVKEEIIDIKDESIDESALQNSSVTEESTVETSTVVPMPVATMTTMPSTVHSIYTRPRSLDIFTTALASANINLDSFMEEEDDPEPAAAQEKEDKIGTVTTEGGGSMTADSITDPLDMQLAALTGEISH